MMANIGRKIANILIRVDPMVSTVAISGLPNPAVVPLEAARVPAKAELMVGAVPPPAMSANDHCVQSLLP